MARKPPRPIDQGWAWVIVFGVFVNLFFMMGIAKSCGIFMVEFIDKFQVSTTFAGSAITVASLLFAIGSPIVGVVGEDITHRKVVIFGGIVGLFGYSMCSLLINMPFIIVFFGIGFGIGNACSYGSGMVMIGKYFRIKRSTATGIALSGTSVGQFAMPPIIEYLLETYGLGGTLLIIGGLYFHCTLAGALFRPIEQYDDEEEVDSTCNEEVHTLSIEEKETVNHEGEYHVPSHNNYNNCDNNHDVHETQTVCVDDGGVKEESNIKLIGNSSVTTAVTHLKTPLSMPRTLEVTRSIGLTNSCSSLYYGSSPMVCPPLSKNGSLTGAENNSMRPPSPKKKKFSLKQIIDFSILRNYVVAYFVVTSFFGFFGLYNFVVFSPAIIVHRGLTKYDKALLISLCGIGDLIARIAVGYFADRNYIQRYKLKAMMSILGSVNIAVFMFAKSFAWMGVHCFVYGFASGAFVCLLPVVMLDFLGLEILSKALGMAILAQGLGGAIGQPFLGALVDLTGSYFFVLLIMSIFLAISGILLMFTPYISRYEQSRQGRKDTKTDGFANKT